MSELTKNDLKRQAYRVYMDAEEQRYQCYKAQKEYWELMKQTLEEIRSVESDHVIDE